MNVSRDALRNEIQYLAEEAFHRKLISGYGDGPNKNEYQIVFQGKPRHLPLEEAHAFLVDLLFNKQDSEKVSFQELIHDVENKNQN